MSTFLTLLSSGIAIGCTFALVAIGLVVIHRVTNVLNFAQGTCAVVGSLVAYSLLETGLPHVLAEGLGVMAAAAVGCLVGVAAIGFWSMPRPQASLIMTMSFATLAYAFMLPIWGDQPVAFQGLTGVYDVGGVTIQRQYVLVIVITLVTFAVLSILFERTYVGKGLTACASNPAAARLLGIDVKRMGLLAFSLGGALGGLAGVLLTPLVSVSFNSDVTLIINGFVPAVFAGLVNPVVALVSGLFLGGVEAMVGGYINAAYNNVVALAVVLVVMIWRSTEHGPVFK